MTRNPFQVALWPSGLYRAGELVENRDYGSTPFDLEAEFGRKAPLMIEVGPGRGHFLLDEAVAHPDWNVLGLEMARSRAQSLAGKANRAGLSNVLVLNALAELALGSIIPRACAQEMHIHFPDPWPKKRHHKRRLLGMGFAPRVAATLAPGALLCVMTDHEDYALEARESMEAQPGLRNLAGAGRFADRPAEPETYFQRRALEQGRGIWYLRFQRSEVVGEENK